MMMNSEGRSAGCGLVRFVSVDDARRAIGPDGPTSTTNIFVREDREGGRMPSDKGGRSSDKGKGGLGEGKARGRAAAGPSTAAAPSTWAT